MLPTGISSRFPEARELRRRARDSVGDSGVVRTVGLGGGEFFVELGGGFVEVLGGRLFSFFGFFVMTGFVWAALSRRATTFLRQSQAITMA